MSDTGTLVMLHGMTGDSAKMQPLAERLVPSGWQILCPQAEAEHPTLGGFAWWLRSDSATEPLSAEAQLQVVASVQRVISELPAGPLIVGGFSQGGAIASAMLEYEVQNRIAGLVLIGPKTARPDELAAALPFLRPREVVWMHGSRDHLLPLAQAEEHAEIFEAAGWPVTRLAHEKGHMVNLNQIAELQAAIQRMADSV